MTLLTVLKQIEAMLNSRPLCKAEGSAWDRDQVLTPAHFWMGRPLNALPEQDYLQLPNITERYEIQQKLVHHYFWKLWSSQYLIQLQQLPKWKVVKENVKVGEIVLLKEDNTPPQVWRKAKVTQVFPGKDGHMRVVMTTDSKKTEFKRSLRKIVRLPIICGRGEMAIEKGLTSVMPLITPEPPLTNEKGDPPLQRSTRKRTSTTPFLSMVIMMCFVACFTPVMSQNTTENKSGLAYFFKTDVMIKIGSYHIEVETNLNPKKDIA